MPSPSRQLTEVAQELVVMVVNEGDTVVDATAGNGHDSLFLAQQVGSTGHVFAFDVQPAAINATSTRLDAAKIAHATLLQASHSQLGECLPAHHRGQLAAVMFNLGYLPGGEKSITTQSATTLSALRSAMTWLRPGGLITLLIYSGHATGKEELATLLPFLREPHSEFAITEVDPQPQRLDPPRLFTIQRRSHEKAAL